MFQIIPLTFGRLAQWLEQQTHNLLVTGSNPVSPIKEKKMPNDTLNYLSDKSEHDLLVILEGFKMLLADAELFDMLAEKLDLSDDVMVELRDDVNNYMEDVV